MPSKLTMYNGALTILGERKLASLTENREPRLKLDSVWDNEFVNRVLQHGQWNFATRAAKMDASSSITPDFGYQYAFEKPDDLVRTIGVNEDEYFYNPLTNYKDEAKTWFADIDPIYVRYVSNDEQFGGDFSLWPANFTEYAEHYLAFKAAPTIAGLSVTIDALKKLKDDALNDAQATDAMESPALFPPKGSWASARQGGRSGDRGRRNQLIG